MKNKINCVITDLDDTIWNWFEMWHSSFEPYLISISKELNIDIAKLKEDFKKLHQQYHTTEVSFAYNNLSLLTDKQKEYISSEKGGQKSIIHTYYSNKKENLKLFNGVLDTLKTLKEKGVIIIGFTESNSFFTKTRIKHLELDGIFDCIYTPVDTGIPENTLRIYHESHWEPKKTEIRHLSKYDKKPNQEILEIILKDFKLNKANTIYIGDKLDRDIKMANDTGVTSVYAKYGSNIESEKYSLLRDVTHWTDEEVNREIETKTKNSKDKIEPNYELKYSFSEILTHFEFMPNEEKINIDLLPSVIQIWNKTIDVQQHFNNLALIIRNLTLTTFTFILAGIGFLFKENITINLYSIKIPIEFLFCFLGIIIISAFYFMDKFWYHKYLIGAVKQATKIENKWNKHFNEMGLSTSISQESNYKTDKIFGIKVNFKSNSEKRFKFYYRPLILSLVILCILILFNERTKSVNYAVYEKVINELTEKAIVNKTLNDSNDNLLEILINQKKINENLNKQIIQLKIKTENKSKSSEKKE